MYFVPEHLEPKATDKLCHQNEGLRFWTLGWKIELIGPDGSVDWRKDLANPKREGVLISTLTT